MSVAGYLLLRQFYKPFAGLRVLGRRFILSDRFEADPPWCISEDNVKAAVYPYRVRKSPVALLAVVVFAVAFMAVEVMFFSSNFGIFNQLRAGVILALLSGVVGFCLFIIIVRAGFRSVICFDRELQKWVYCASLFGSKLVEHAIDGGLQISRHTCHSLTYVGLGIRRQAWDVIVLTVDDKYQAPIYVNFVGTNPGDRILADFEFDKYGLERGDGMVMLMW
tara:strand:+ start:4431 stop:5093 length:663 start_codon:yes stop_codon:yes gene_type:complete